MKIGFQLTAAVIAVIVFSVAGTAFLLVRDAGSILREETGSKAQLLIDSIEGAASELTVKKDLLSLNVYLTKISGLNGLVMAAVTDTDGMVTASTISADRGKKIASLYPYIAAGSGEYDTPSGEPVLAYASPLLIKSGSSERNIGSIYAVFSAKKLNDRLMFLYLKSGALALLIIAASIFFITAFTRSLIKPLNSLIEGTEEISDGNLRHKIKVGVKNEFLALANSLNNMTEKLNDYYDGILAAFTMALDTKDKYTPGHSKRVARYAVGVAQEMKLPEKQIENLRIAALLKDIGNIGVEGRILRKKDTLEPEDIIKIQKHPEISAKILTNIRALNEVVPIILQHHERYDGHGYPNGLKGQEISREAKILAIADAYDAMVTKREHREAMTFDEAIYELRLNKEKQFDPEITELFVMYLHSGDLDKKV